MPDDESKLFTVTEAERLRTQIEPILIEAMDSRRKMTELDAELNALSERIQRAGGMSISYEKIAKRRIERNHLEDAIQSAIERIHSTGCLIKDLDVGLLDFPSRIDNQEVYLCWRLGEDRIRFYHRQDEGFSSRKPIDPRDADRNSQIQ